MLLPCYVILGVSRITMTRIYGPCRVGEQRTAKRDVRCRQRQISAEIPKRCGPFLCWMHAKQLIGRTASRRPSID
jgi:hypothetical protein